MSTREKNVPALPLSPEELEELHRQMAGVNADLDDGATYTAHTRMVAGGRKKWLPRGVAEFFANGLDCTERLLATVRQRDARVADLEKRLKESDALVASCQEELRGWMRRAMQS